MDNKKDTGDSIEVIIYTDPLCCWSAALQPHINSLIENLDAAINIRYCLAGMIPDWNSFTDPLNSVIKPAQMGPVWMEAKYITNTEIDDSIWITDPPSSSFPPCIAIKTAGLQSKEAEVAMLLALREAVTKRGLNISKEAVLSKVAHELAVEFPTLFDVNQFRKEYNQPASRDALRKDMNEIKLHRITRFPTLIIKKKGYQSTMITGYRPYDVLLSAFSYLNSKQKVSSAT